MTVVPVGTPADLPLFEGWREQTSVAEGNLTANGTSTLTGFLPIVPAERVWAYERIVAFVGLTPLRTNSPNVGGGDYKLFVDSELVADSTAALEPKFARAMGTTETGLLVLDLRQPIRVTEASRLGVTVTTGANNTPATPKFALTIYAQLSSYVV